MGRWIVLAALLASSACAELKWAASYDAAFAQAKKEKKNVMVMLSKEDCPACEYMSDIVFEEKMVSDEVYKRFVPVHLDIYGDAVPSSLGYIGTPTFYFLDTKGKKLGRHDGAANIPTFLGILRKVK